jgi:predicted TIM-barrel fold metal-dependent hydrolase
VAVEGFRILDADAHVVEPASEFAAWTDHGTAAMELPADTPYNMCGDLELVRDQLDHGFDAPSYLRAMDAQGIDAAVVYPSIGLFVPFLPALGAEGSAAACRSYNEWLAGWCDHEPSRLAGVALVPLGDIDLAVREARFAHEAGLIGVLARPNHLYGRNLGDPDYDELWAACAELGLTVSVHEGMGLAAAAGPTIGGDRFTGFAARHALSHPMEQMAAMASLVLDGALERHPELLVAFLESGTGWLPYWLARLDDHIDWLTPERPSATELFERQCVISSEADDDCIAMVVEHVGAEHVLWASDFPHPDALYPGAPEAFLTECEEQGVDADDAKTILWDAPLTFYALEKRFT